MLQYLFGLKVRECMLLESSMITKAGVHVARGIAYNKHDRDIPAVTPEQQSFIEKMYNKKSGEFALKEDRRFRLGLVNLYAYAAKKLKLKHPDHFRHQFIKNRFLFLKQCHSTPDALNIIKAETGYSKLVEIKNILKELKVIEL